MKSRFPKRVLAVLLAVCLFLAGLLAPGPVRAEKRFRSGLLAIQVAIHSTKGDLMRITRVKGWYKGGGKKRYFDEKTDFRGWAFFKISNDVFANGLKQKMSLDMTDPDFKLDRIDFQNGKHINLSANKGFIGRYRSSSGLPIDLIQIMTGKKNRTKATIVWEKSSKLAAYYYMGSFPFSRWTPVLQKALRLQWEEKCKEPEEDYDPTKN
jgi:hypothetical protein